MVSWTFHKMKVSETAFEKPNQSLGWLFSNNERNNKLFDRPELLGQFIDNHDMQRFTNLAIQNNQDPVDTG